MFALLLLSHRPTAFPQPATANKEDEETDDGILIRELAEDPMLLDENLREFNAQFKDIWQLTIVII